MIRRTLVIIFFSISTFATAQNKLPDWALGPFLRPAGVNPLITPSGNRFWGEIKQDSTVWESGNIFNPAANLKFLL